MRDNYDYLFRFNSELPGKAGVTVRFDYVNKDGTYLHSREGVYSNSKIYGARTFNRNDASEKVNEQIFKTSKLVD